MAQLQTQSDAAGKLLFAHKRMAADLLRLLGDAWVNDLDLDRLERLPAEHVAQDLRKRLADMSWWAPFKDGTGRPAGAGVLLHIELQSSPHPHMAERMAEYMALLRRDLRRSGWLSAAGGRVAVDLPLVVYNGRAKWSAPRQPAEWAWAPPELRAFRPRRSYRLVDAKDYAGDDAADGNLVCAMLALDAAPAHGLAPALERAVTLMSAVGDDDLWRSFESWCEGVLRPRLGDRMPTLANLKETTMLAETLREWEEQKIDEGRREGMRLGQQEGMRLGQQEGMRAVREVLKEERALLCNQAGWRFGAATGTELATVLAGVEDGAELARIGRLIIDCHTGPDFLARARSR